MFKSMMKKILLVDDEKEVCDMLKKFLTMKGYKVSIALSGREAIEKARKEKPHIMFLDIKMPDMDGVEVLKKVKELYKEIIVVMITGVKDDEVGRMCIEMGADDYVTKPLGFDYLENVLRVKLLSL